MQKSVLGKFKKMSETVSVNVIQSKEESRKIDPDLENLYMPSNWVVRVKPEQSVPLHVKVYFIIRVVKNTTLFTLKNKNTIYSNI